MKLRPANLTLDVARSIIDFMTKYHTTDMKYFPKPEKLFEKYNFYAILTDDNKLVGWTSYSVLSEWLAMTHATCIHPDYRGKGFGKKATAAMLDVLREKGFGKVCCEIYADNTPMLKIKLEQGFLVEGYYRDHYDPGKHEYHLGKFLDESLIS